MYDFGHGHRELYTTQPKNGRAKEAADWYRCNPHRLHLGCIGLEIEGLKPNDIQEPRQTLDMWNGIISSKFLVHGTTFCVQTVCHPKRDMIGGQVKGKNVAINLRFQNYWVSSSTSNYLTYTCEFSPTLSTQEGSWEATAEASAHYWNNFWNQGAAVNVPPTRHHKRLA